MTSRGPWLDPGEHRERRGAGVARGWRGTLVLLAWLIAMAACGGDAEPTGGGAEPETADIEPVPAETEVESPPTGVDEPGADRPSGESDAAEGGGLLNEVDGEGDSEGGGDEGTGDDETEGIAAEPAAASRIPAGTRLSVISEEDISTADYAPNDPVLVTVAEHVMDSAGAVLLPRGVNLLGRVVDAAGSGGPGEAPVLEIAFETLSAWDYERPIEGTVVGAEVVLDAEAQAMRRASAGRVAAVTVVPGKILAGSVIIVELRAPVLVPPAYMWPDSVLLADSVFLPDSVFRVDSFPGGNPVLQVDTVPRRDTLGADPYSR